MKDYKYFLGIQRKAASIAASIDHTCDIGISAYHTSLNGTPFLTIAVVPYGGGPMVHFTFYSFKTKKYHKQVLAAFKEYLTSGKIVTGAELYK